MVGSSTGFRPIFELARTPSSTDLVRVYVDGVPNTDWDYHPEQQAVVFRDGLIPEPYSLIEIEYPAACP